MTLSAVLPLAVVMIAGPQIISSFMFATSKNWARNSAAYVGGAALSVTGFVSVAYLIAEGASSSGSSGSGGSSDTTLDWIILGLVTVLILRAFLTRKTSEPPKWMAKLQSADAKFAFVLGLLLLGIFPTDILTSVTAGLHVARHGDSWWQVLPFVGVTLLLLGAPAIAVVLLGKRASAVLPKVRDWMNEKSWVVSEIVLGFFAVITVNSLVG